MSEKNFLFKLGLLLAPALLASSSVTEAALLAFSAVILLAAADLFDWLLEKIPSSFFGASRGARFFVKGRLRSASPPPARGMKPRAGTATDTPAKPAQIPNLRQGKTEKLAGKAGAPFAVELAGILAVAFLAAGADRLAGFYRQAPWFRMGIFFPVVLVNTLLLLRRETWKIQAKLSLWFVFALLVLNIFKNVVSPYSFEGSFVNFTLLSLFLLAVGILLEKKGWTL